MSNQHTFRHTHYVQSAHSVYTHYVQSAHPVYTHTHYVQSAHPVDTHTLCPISTPCRHTLQVQHTSSSIHIVFRIIKQNTESKSKSELVSVHAVKAYGGVEVRFQSFLNLPSNGGTWSALRSVSIVQKAGCDPGQVRSFQRRQKSAVSTGNEISTRLLASPRAPHSFGTQ